MIKICVYWGVTTTTLMNKSLAKMRFCDAPEQEALQLKFGLENLQNLCVLIMRDRARSLWASYALENQTSKSTFTRPSCFPPLFLFLSVFLVCIQFYISLFFTICLSFYYYWKWEVKPCSMHLKRDSSRCRSETFIFIKIQPYILQCLTRRTGCAVKTAFSRSIIEVDEAAIWTFLATVTHKS